MKKWKNPYDMPTVLPVKVPDGKSGPWEVFSYEVTKEVADFQMLRSAISSERGRYVPAGSYKGIKRGGNIIMSNTPDEIRDCREFFKEAKGRVLINGLGLGIVLDAVLSKVNEDDTPAVTEVVVVEKSPDVFNLVSPTFLKDKRVKIELADAYEYKAAGNFDAVWHDIWDDISPTNLKGMKKLHLKYGRKSEWQGSWCKRECMRLKRSEERERSWIL